MKHNRIFLSVAMAAIMLVSLCAVSASTLSVSAAQGSSSTPAVVGAPVGAGAPGVCSVNGTNLELFIRVAADNSIVWKESPDGTNWTSNETSLGGTLTAPPAANATWASTGAGEASIYIFARGTDGSVYERVISPNSTTTQITQTNSSTYTISGWTSLGGQVASNTGPSVCSWGPGRLDVFVQGTNGAMYQKVWNGSSWTNWIDLGGKLTSAPGATAMGPSPNQIGVFVAGTGGTIYYKHWNGSAWSGWVNVGGQVLSGTSPAAYNWGSQQIGWLVTGTDGNLYRNWVGSSSGYEGIAGALTSSPSATAKQAGVIDVFARGSTSTFAALYQTSYNYNGSGQWSVWTALGGV
ncbi:MAG: hypothetical protein WCG09_06945 [Halobacteriota archaeon]|jgi:hypothetical protein